MSYSLRYPRRVLVRSGLRLFGRAAMALLTKTTITGRQNLPERGPLILVGNHVAVLEVVMMVLYAPYLIEVIGTGDIPLDWRFGMFVRAYGMIPIKRGSMDREGLNMALDILRQNGVIGIFPEGGIWDSPLKQGRTGVAWLSHKANAPIIPIGFGGVEGALGAALTLKRPHVTMNIGPALPPIGIDGKPRKQALEDGAALVMEHIEALIPEADKQKWLQITDERFDFEIQSQCFDGSVITPPADLTLSHPAALGQFFHRSVILSTLANNLQLPVQPLQKLESDPDAIAAAAQAVLDYLNENPYFLTYRFGYEIGGAMRDGLAELRDLARWASQSGAQLILNPIRRYRRSEDGEEIVEQGRSRAHRL